LVFSAGSVMVYLFQQLFLTDLLDMFNVKKLFYRSVGMEDVIATCIDPHTFPTQTFNSNIEILELY
jgi:hypothetical protein